MPDTYAFTRTREQMRTKILVKLGAYGSGETPDSADSDLVYEAIDFRLKELHALGTLWYQVAGAQSDVALTGGTATANAPADCLFPVSFNVRVNGVDKPLELIDHRQYQAIPNKDDTGEPGVCFFSGGVFRFWPVPDVDYTAKLTYEAIAADTASATAPDIPVAMMRAFITIVSSDLAEDFGKSESEIIRRAADAREAMKTIRALNVQRTDAGTTEAEYF